MTTDKICTFLDKIVADTQCFLETESLHGQNFLIIQVACKSLNKVGVIDLIFFMGHLKLSTPLIGLLTTSPNC